MQHLPIGIQDFGQLRENNFLYVDKTEDIYRLIESGRFYFLARPRRFGKSLLLSTIKEIFKGRKELFKDLWIEDKWDWSKQNPVLHFSFNSLDYQGKGLENALLEMLAEQAEEHGIQLIETTIKSRFKELITKLTTAKGAVVILMDEYDKPIIDYLAEEERHQAHEHQKILKIFYSVLKDKGTNIRLLLITGVSKFGKTGVFSELNNLDDVSVDINFSSIVGYTQAELDSYFQSYRALAKKYNNVNDEQLTKELKAWYNGYTWDGITYVYNPFSILNFFKKGSFLNFWFESGTPTFLINILKGRFYYDFEGVKVGMTAFSSYDIDKLETVPLLFQTGYLTIKKKIRRLYTLGYPNLEVKESMLQHLIAAFRHDEASNSTVYADELEEAFNENNLEKVIDLINGMFATIPYPIFEANQEKYYHSLVHLLFTYLGIYIKSEVSTSNGRADAIVETETHIYIIEFKLNKSAAKGIEQIRDKNYAAQYQNSGKTIIALGINFSSKVKKVNDWKALAL